MKQFCYGYGNRRQCLQFVADNNDAEKEYESNNPMKVEIKYIYRTRITRQFLTKENM